MKPFSPREVVLRVKAVLRRSVPTTFFTQDTTTKDVTVFPHLTIDNDAHRVTADGELNTERIRITIILSESA